MHDSYLDECSTLRIIRRRHENVVVRARGKGMGHLPRPQRDIAGPVTDVVNGTVTRF